MARKRGITTLAEVEDSRENAIKYGNQAKRNFNYLIPHRIDTNTIIFIKPHQDKTEQINRFMNRLEKDRMNY
jgi:hypothetical protein